MENRKEELEKKRQRLAELRRAREERKSALGDQSGGSVSPAPSPSTTANTSTVNLPVSSTSASISTSTSKADIDSLVNSLLNSSPQAQSPTKMQNSPLNNSTNNDKCGDKVTKELKITETFLFEVAPLPPVINYDKQVQTTSSATQDSSYLSAGTEENYKELEEEEGGGGGAHISSLRAQDLNRIEEEEKLRAEILQQELDRIKLLKQQQKEIQKKAQKEREDVVLSQVETDRILASKDFVSFIESSAKIMEKALIENPILLRDYSIDYSQLNSSISNKAKMSIISSFYSDKYCKNTIVSAVECSSKFSELFLAAYKHQNPLIKSEKSHILIWNMLIESRPEFIFESQSNVTCAIFSADHPNYVFAGCHSGQVLLFDTRVNKRSAQLSTPMTLNGSHSHPIQSISIVGTQNLNQLVSCSSDGKFCVWQMDMFAKPLETLDLVRAVPGRSIPEEVILDDFCFVPSDVTTFMVGTEDGSLNIANRYDKAGSKSGIYQNETYLGHSAPITSMQFNQHFRQSDQPKLLLSSSFDWSVKLWKISAFADYVTDVRWAPHHQSIFCASEASGNLHLWDINKDMEMPIDTFSVGNGGGGITRLNWSADGKRIATGSTDGKVNIVNVPQTMNPMVNEDVAHMKKLFKF